MPEDVPIQLLNPTGRVVTVSSHMKEELLKKGFRIIINPKEEYYPTYDSQADRYLKDQNIMENIPVSDILEVDKL